MRGIDRQDKAEAIRLRKLGKSYRAIKKELRIPMSTLSNWLSPHGWSKKIADSLSERAKKDSAVRIRDLNKIRGENLKKLYEEAEKEAVIEFQNLKYHPLFIAGLVLYWGEGDKVSKNSVRISNTDPAAVRLYINFLFHVCGVRREKVRAGLLLYPDLDDGVCKKFWAKSSGLGEGAFNKSTVIIGRHKTKRVRNGVCVVGFGSCYFKHKILLWIKLLS